ncbi:MAG: hypothetical protein ACE5JI_19845 [Acidobacteriota bacterium]
MIAGVVAPLSAHVAAGSLVVVALLAFRNRLPESFLRFCTLASTVTALLAWALSAGYPSTARCLLAAASLFWYVWLRRRGDSWIPAGLGTVAALGALGAECFGAVAEPVSRPLCLAGSLSSGLLLGSVSVSMVLGHWYLVAPQLSIAPLKQGSLCFWGAAGVRAVIVGLALLFGGWETLHVTRMADVLFSTPALFFFIRALMGLGAPLVVAGLIWQTVRMRSTQSATGLLYVALILVLFGELVSQFLTLTTGIPL